MQVLFDFSGHLGVVLGLSRLRSGETSGEMQVSRVGHEKLRQKTNFPVHFCVCVFMYVYVYVCVCFCDRVCSICLFFLLLFCFFIQCTYFFPCICNLSI